MNRTFVRRLCISLIGVGLASMLADGGTFAAYTATTTNPNDTFAAGTLKLTDTTGLPTTPFNGVSAPNGNGTSDPRGSGTDCSGSSIASACKGIIKSVNVAAKGIEPGQYLTAKVTITNAGTLPATIAMQVQHLETANGNGIGGPAAVAARPTGASCASELSNANTNTINATSAFLVSDRTGTFGGCTDLGKGLAITIADDGGGSVPHCVYGGFDSSTSASSPSSGSAPLASSTSQAPPTGMFVAAGPDTTGSSSAGTCDDLTAVGNLGTPASPIPISKSPPANDLFGVQEADTSSNACQTGTGGLAALNGCLNSGIPQKLIFIPGTSTQPKSVTNAAAYGGDLTHIKQWAPGESHTFTVTIALPDAGAQVVHLNGAGAGTDDLNVSNDDIFHGGAIVFDLLWLATQ
ncbi:MAG TPA: hypothetical protein VFS62_04675 [Chloroflexota bacterium]|nr:hypothetical protein [Chloroflexota bacterium]